MDRTIWKRSPLPDVALGLLHHPAEGRPVKEGGHRAGEAAGRLCLLLPGAQEAAHLLQLQHRLVVVDLHVLQGHVHHEDDLLPQMVKGDDLVKEHQVHILEGLAVRDVTLRRGFLVGQVIVGEVPHQPPGEGGQARQPGAAVGRQHLAEIGSGILGRKPQAPCLHLPVPAGDLQLGVVAQKGVPPPLLVGQGGFQQVAVGGHVLQDPQGLYGGEEVREDLAVHRQGPVLALGGNGLHLGKAGGNLHVITSKIKNSFGLVPAKGEEKTPLTETLASVKDE